MWQSNANFQPFSVQFSQQLESLRGISAIIVLFSHCFQAFIAPFDLTIYSLVRLLGQAAVMIFFVLSGYLIGHSMQKNIAQFGKFNLKHYTQQRCKRILPPFMFALLLTLALYWLAPFAFASGTREFVHTFGLMIRTEYALNLSDFLGSAIFLNGFITPTVSANAALWSLSYEVWFYVLAGCLPFLVYNLQRINSIIFLTLLICLSWLNIQFLMYFLVWCFAFAVSFSSINQALFDLLQPLKLFFIGMAGLIAAFDFYQFHLVYLTAEYTTENFTIFNLCIGIAFTCWLVQLQQGLRDFRPQLMYSAQFSYTLYVTHFPLLLFFMGCFPQSLTTLPHGFVSLIVLMILLIFIASVLAKFLEPTRKIT